MRLPWKRNEEEQSGEVAGGRPARITNVADEKELSAVLDASFKEPAVLFLHDPWCPISGRASHEIERVDADVHLIDVSSSRELSKAVEEATGVRHESPQVFVLSGGRVAWHASHMSVRAGAVQGALEAAAAG